MQLAEAYVDIKGRDMGLAASFGKAKADVDAATKTMEARVEQMYERIGAVGKRMTFLLTLPILGLGAAGVKFAADWEQAEIAFTTMLGSAERAKRMLKDLEAFAAKTPFELPGLINATRKLLAYGFAAEEVIPMMTAIGDAVSAMGGGAFEIERVTRAFGQMKAKGKVSAEEMRQLAELGIPVWEMLAKKVGVSIPEAMKQAERGTITAATGISAVLEGMSERFAGSMEKQSKSLWGLFSTLKDVSAMFLRKLLEGLVPGLEKLIRKATAVLEILDKLPPSTKKQILVVAALTAVLGPLLWVFSKLPMIVLGCIVAVKGLTTAVAFLTAHPLVALATGIAAVILIVTGLILKLKANKQIAGELASSNVELAKSYEDLAEQIHACKTEEERSEMLKAEATKSRELLEKIEERKKAIADIEAMLAGKKRMVPGWTIPKARSSLEELRAENKKLEAEYAESARRRHLIVHEPLAPQVAVIEGAAEDAMAAEKLLWDIRYRNASEWKQLMMECDRAMAEAKGPKLQAATLADYADRFEALRKKMANDEIDKAREVQAAQTKVYEAEAAAYGEKEAVKLRLAGKTFEAERTEAKTTYEAEARELMRVFLTGEDVRNRMAASYAQYFERITDIGKREQEEIKRRAEENRRIHEEALDKIIAAEARSLEKRVGLMERAQNIYEKMALDLTRILEGETAARLKALDFEHAKEAAEIKESVTNEQARAILLQGLDITTATKRQELLDDEMRGIDELGRRWREEQRERIGFVSPMAAWEKATLAGARMRWAEPPQMQQNRLDERQVSLLDRLLGEILRLTGVNESNLPRIREALEKLNPAY